MFRSEDVILVTHERHRQFPPPLGDPTCRSNVRREVFPRLPEQVSTELKATAVDHKSTQALAEPADLC